MQDVVVAERLFCTEMGSEGVMSPGGILLWAKRIGVLDIFLANKEESLLEPRVREANCLSHHRGGGPSPKKKASSQKGRGKRR